MGVNRPVVPVLTPCRCRQCKGNGVDLIIYAARRAEPSGPNPNNDMCLSGIRLIAEAALHDDTEVR